MKNIKIKTLICIMHCFIINAGEEKTSDHKKGLTPQAFSELKAAAMENYYRDPNIYITKRMGSISIDMNRVYPIKYLQSFIVKDKVIINEYCESLREKLNWSLYVKYPTHDILQHFPLCTKYNPEFKKSVESKDPFLRGKGPLLQRAAQVESNTVNFLINECNFDPNEQNPADGNTALHVAGDNRQHKNVIILLAAQANPNIQNHDGKTSLHATAQVDEWDGIRNRFDSETQDCIAERIVERTSIVTRLLNAQANPYIMDNKNKTACDYAQHMKIRNALLSVMNPASKDNK